MFTGITQETTTVVSNVDGVLRLSTPAATDNLPLGASICVNGACMTVSSTGEGWFGFDLTPETHKTTTLGTLLRGAMVNLERPLQTGVFSLVTSSSDTSMPSDPSSSLHRISASEIRRN